MASQRFRFADLYKGNREAVEKALLSMWCGETKNKSQESYVSQLHGIIHDIFAPESAKPLVQCMNSYESVHSVSNETAEAVVGDLWRKSLPDDKYYPPYEHQYRSWRTLLEQRTDDGKFMSLCVTTGTGSGKTECFMMPLVKDLIDKNEQGHVQAIFLYPLNALMEDQKSRLEKLLAGTNLTYAVYNGDMPERELKPGDKNWEQVKQKIDDIKGRDVNDDGEVYYKYPHAVATREELRKRPANILLTNPTMLEYILLRGKDANLIQPDLKSLAWIAIDETHTYTGAGAAEMAMLLRRVLMAYGVTTDDVRFATSSATIGDDLKALQEFIARMTGLEMRQVAVIDGKRKGADHIPHDEYETQWNRLINETKETDGYISLDNLFEGEGSISDKLAMLDDMCQKAEEAGLTDLRAKVHYFYRVPNRGLFVDLTQHIDGSFKIFTDNDPNAGHGDRAPLLEMSRCKHCGEYVAVAEVDFNDSTYRPITMDDSDMFDLEDTEETRQPLLIFALSNEDVKLGDNNGAYLVEGNHFREDVEHKGFRDWHVIANTQCSCPYCGKKLTKKAKADDENTDVMGSEEEDGKKLQKFRVASDFVSRLIAPSTLELMTAVDDGVERMHDGQQYISFVDSRQSAAQGTIKQNVEEEKLWVYNKIYAELAKRAAEGLSKEKAQEKAIEMMKSPEQLQKGLTIMNNLNSSDPAVVSKQLAEMAETPHLTWKEMYELFATDSMLDMFCQQFAERSELSEECVHGKLTEKVKKRYIHSILVSYLSKRPLSASAPETMGLFTSYYPKLEEVKNHELPKAVEEMNAMLGADLKITKEDWKNLLQIFLDYTVRSNESVYLKMSDTDPMDIFKCVRFATQKDRRRSIRQPQVRERSGNRSRVIRLLAHLIATEKNVTIADAIKGYQKQLGDVLDAMWKDLTETYKLITQSTYYDEKVGMHVKDNDLIVDDVHYPPYRLNLADFACKCYTDAWLCDTNASKENESRHVACMRPVEVNFKGYAPYLVGGEPRLLVERYTDEWAVETFGDRVEEIKRGPKLFIQAEHTAQVDKMIARQVQKDFKSHKLNILACSTTMEMGVDLGDLELVMMTSVPPQPANYKQRAGRSGRRGQTRSAAVTLCGSDAVGMRTLYHPMESVITRTVASPTVDLDSAQVIQRHVNSFLVREFAVFNLGDHAGSITQNVVDYYTKFKIERDGRYLEIIHKPDNKPVSPVEGLGEQDGTAYQLFNERCSKALDDDLKKRLSKLLAGTIFDNKVQYVVQQAQRINTQCYEELERRLDELKQPYMDAKSEGQRRFFMLKYIEPLATQLLGYWATHRFTPNANMPVNVVEFDINSTNQQHYVATRPSNPSYPLRTALQQYAPGNPIARDGMVKIVRGIRYTDFFRPTVTFKKLYHNSEQVVIDIKDEIDKHRVWPVSQSTELELLEPTEFVPDMNESASRILDKNEFTRVNAQLIGTDPWLQDRTEPHLFDARSSRESGDAKILYYNEGIGYGYCHCTKCGRTVLEQWAAATASNPDLLPPEMNAVKPNDTEKPRLHLSLIKKNKKAQICVGCHMPEAIRRNVVLGGTIQTDFTEIRIRHLNEDWISTRDGQVQLLTTLGVLFTQALAEVLSVERGDLDFTITPNGHICIFDTNPGGSGYANQLVAMDLLKEVVKKSMEYVTLAEERNSKDVLIDKQTLHYLNNIDVQQAKAWLEEEISAQRSLPEAIQSIFPDATETSLVKLQRAFALSQRDSVLFVDNDYDKWNYNGANHGWQAHFYPYFANRGQQTTFCVVESKDCILGEPNMDMLRSLNGWMQDVVKIQNPYIKQGLYPLAYIDGRLYFTNNPEHKSLNDRWAGGTMYYTRTSNPTDSAQLIDTRVDDNKTKIFFLEEGDPMVLTTRELGNVILTKGKCIVEQFFDHCEAHPGGKLQVSYQDEHLKSITGMILTLQTIEHFIKKLGVDFELEFVVERYESEHGKADSVTAEQPSSRHRDMWLTNLSKSWLADLKADSGINGELHEVYSRAKRALSHWRVLSFEYEGKRLSIYPNGGLLNGWFLGEQPNNERYDTQTITHDTEITLCRSIKIKYDVTVEDV